MLLLLCCSILVSSVTFVSAQTVAPSAPDTYVIRFPTFDMYAPTRIVVTYTYTQSYSVNVTDFGQTLHQETQTPESMEFDTAAVDVYNITFAVSYDIYVNQTVTIELFENQTGIAKTMELDMNSKGFLINMVISTSTPPTYPDTNQIVNGIKTYFANQILVLQATNNGLVNSVMDTVTVFAALTAVSFGVSIAALVFANRALVKKAKLAAFTNNKQKNSDNSGDRRQ
jgi:hypothetical protein